MAEQPDLVLPRLYKKAKTGKIVICDITVTGDTILVMTGQLDGKQTPHTTPCVAMNTGKKNATTPAEQALKEAKAKHVKKIKGGYVEDASGDTDVRLPQKVKKYQEQKANIIFPCWMSPKLNGLNGEFRNEEDLVLCSRGGEVYPMLEHMRKDILLAMKSMDTITLNGELYHHGTPLGDISSAVNKHNELSPELEFHVFEIPDNSLIFDKKRLVLAEGEYTSVVQYVPTLRADSHEDIERYFLGCLKKKYEGIIIRNSKGTYKYNQRSSDVFKYKLPEDDEFLIVGYKIDKNGHPVFVCQVGDNTFKAKPKGEDPERKAIAAIADTWIGKWLNVEFEEYSKIGVPLKPVGIGLRKCDADGNPLE